MELIKKNIHTDHVKCRAATQITLEDDTIVTDSKPDIAQMIMDKGTVKIEEIKAGTDRITVRGKLLFSVMYLADGGDRPVNSLEGSIPFEESLYMEGVQSGDAISMDTVMEDLTIGMVNPRKLSVQCMIGMKAWVDELYDVESGVDIYSPDPVECRKTNVELTEMVLQKKDIFRIKQEAELPQNLPNVFSVIWNDVVIGELDFKACDDKISVQGDMNFFVLYEGEGEEEPVRWYESSIPFSGVVDCYGCRDGFILDIDHMIDHAEIEVRPDFDGEERMLGIDVLINMDIKLYEEVKTELLSDVYGMQKELIPVKSQAVLKSLLVKNMGKARIADKLKVNSSAGRVLQVCHTVGEVQVEEMEILDNSVNIMGNVIVKALYVTSEDSLPFNSVKGMIPFTYALDAPGVTKDCTVKVKGGVDQMNVTMADSEELEVKAVISIAGIVFRNEKNDVITDVAEEDLDIDKLSELPSMVAYIAKEGDTLWEIGKRYYTPISQLKETNGISGDLKPGEKILVVKSMSR